MFLLNDTEGQDFAPIQFGTNPGTTGWIIMFAIFLVLVIFGFIIYKRSRINNWRHQGIAIGNEEIFKRLCEANDLNPRESFLMRRLVYDLRLQNPLLPFVDQPLFDRYADRLNGNRRKLMLGVRHKVFA